MMKRHSRCWDVFSSSSRHISMTPCLRVCVSSSVCGCVSIHICYYLIHNLFKHFVLYSHFIKCYMEKKLIDWLMNLKLRHVTKSPKVKVLNNWMNLDPIHAKSQGFFVQLQIQSDGISNMGESFDRWDDVFKWMSCCEASARGELVMFSVFISANWGLDIMKGRQEIWTRVRKYSKECVNIREKRIKPMKRLLSFDLKLLFNICNNMNDYFNDTYRQWSSSISILPMVLLLLLHISSSFLCFFLAPLVTWLD